MLQTESPQALAELNAAFAAIAPAYKAANDVEDSEARESIQSSLIDLGLHLQKGYFNAAFAVIRKISENHGFTFLNSVSFKVIRENNKEGSFSETVAARQEWLADLWQERQDLFKNHITPLSEKVMSLVTGQLNAK